MSFEPIQIQGLILGVLAWAWFFWLVPERAFAVGIVLQDPPLFFRMASYKLLRLLALLGLAAFGFLLVPPPADLLTVDYALIVQHLLDGLLMGPLLAIVLTLLFFFALPMAVVKYRHKQEEEPGEWLTVTLVFYRWALLGVAIFAAVGWLGEIPILGEPFLAPLNDVVGAALPILAGLFYLLWWGWPSMFVARLAERPEPIAIDALPDVRRWGLPQMLALLVRRKRQQRQHTGGPGQKLCPSCMRPIDQLEFYESLDFDSCPHCGELIPPVFGLRDYIERLADRAVEIIQSRDQQAKTRKAREAERHEQDVIQRILRATLTMAMRERGTDLHLGSDTNRFIIRCRTDGVLFTMLDLDMLLMRPVISTIKVQANLDISERRKPQDGSIKATIDGRKLDLRVNTSPTPDGETASLRLLYEARVLGSLENLGMSHRALRLLHDTIARPHGLVLVTGPTGSGKSTTLYNSLGAIANGKRNIITLEDPIEFNIEGLTQMQVDPRKNFTFASGLRTILRQDPDVIMVGEIRDGETAKMAVDAAMTGHLVFSTLHTIDTISTLDRLLDLGVESHRHAEALVLLVAQRLIRLVCRECAEQHEVSAAELEQMGLAGGPSRLVLKRGVGCELCHQTGYYERAGIYELLQPESELRNLIAQRAPASQLRQVARNHGMRTLLEDGMVKVVLGRTTIEEVVRVTN